MKAYLGVDPSYRNMGATLFHREEDTFCFHINCFKTRRKKQNFQDSFKAAEEQIFKLFDWAFKTGVDFGAIQPVMEIAPPLSRYSAGLWLLDGMLFKSFKDHGLDPILVQPRRVSRFLGLKKANKKVSLKAANELLYQFARGRKTKIIYHEKEIKLSQKTEIFRNHDEAESFLFLVASQLIVI